MPRKGLSLEEKRTRLRELFHETAEFYNLKELEKLAPKRKGIVSQSVKDVLQSLVDDNLVNADKCGNQTVYWSLPSEECQKRRTKLEQLRTELKDKEKEVSKLETVVSELQSGREESDERAALLKRISTQEARTRELDSALHRFATLDPAAISKMKEDTSTLIAGANRWTDNVYTCQQYLTNRFGVEKKDLNKQFEIPEELDYLEE